LLELFSWRTAIAAAASGPAIAWLLVYLSLERVPATAAGVHTAPAARWREVLRSPDSMRYVAAYSCHMWELFGMRAWLVPFLAFSAVLHGPTFASPTTLAAILALAGIPASFLGAELSARFDRRFVVITLMLLSAAAGTTVGLSVSTSWAVLLAMSLLHHALVMSDSAALTSGLVAVSAPESRGTAMAIYSMAGFGTASLASFAIGGVLDLLGGQSIASWPLAFAVMVSSNVLGAMLLARAR
jgi:MFS family permease